MNVNSASLVPGSVRIVFTGVLDAAFVPFIEDRARRLDLATARLQPSAGRCSVDVSGPPDLIDAFEMACSLGPLSCLVWCVTRE